MRDSNSIDHRNPRLIKSHWDLDDEFLNVRSDALFTNSDASERSVSTSQLVFALTALIALFSAIAIATKIGIRNANEKAGASNIGTHTATEHTGCTDQTKSRKLDAITGRSQTMHSQLLVLKTSTGISATEHAIKEPVLVKENRSEVIHEASAMTTKNYDSSSLTMQDMVKEAAELAEKIKIATCVFEEQGLDAHRAQDFVLQRHLSDLQEQSRRDHEHEILAVELKLRSVELEMAERRHRETIVTHRMDPNWMNKYLAARDSVVGFTFSSMLYLLGAVMLDQFCKSGMDTFRSELLCDCQNLSSWNYMPYFFNSYLCSLTPSCWVHCFTKWGSRIVLVVTLRFLFGFKLQHTLPLISALILWKQVQVIWSHIATYALVSFCIYLVLMYRSHSVQRRCRSEPEIGTALLENYLIECDLVKVGISATAVMLFCCFEVVEGGFLFSLLTVGENYNYDL